MDKLKLLEVFKRIALPMPQRKYNDQRSLGKKLCELRVTKNIKISDIEQSRETLDKSFENDDTNHLNTSDKNGILKSPINKLKCEQNNIRLSNDIHQVSNDQKRKSNSSSNHSPPKRQKILWP
ncbi:GSCOCG00009400001-RA-CDS [Cotesia congregata]|nr:GSCOCG00009400001-RA-CDS [Cotesia congregata]